LHQQKVDDFTAGYEVAEKQFKKEISDLIKTQQETQKQLDDELNKY